MKSLARSLILKMDYFISDLHFGHRNVIRYCNRPFDTVSEMNAGIIENWNNVVTDKDRVFVVGDVALCGTEETKGIHYTAKRT